MKVILLSAGQGRRLLPLTRDVPKCALDVAGHSMLDWQLHEISKCDIDEVIVVTGFRAVVVANIISAATHRYRLRTFQNPFYASSDNLGTAWIAREEMHEPFVIINGDTLFEATVLRDLLNSETPEPITLVTNKKAEYDEDDMKVITSGSQLLRVGKKLPLEKIDSESIGMMSFQNDGPELFRNKVAKLMFGEDGLKLWYLSAIDALAKEGHVGVCQITDKLWCEVDDHTDLAQATMLFSERVYEVQV